VRGKGGRKGGGGGGGGGGRQSKLITKIVSDYSRCANVKDSLTFAHLLENCLLFARGL